MVFIPAPKEPRPCWFVNASKAKTDQCLEEGVWENDSELDRHVGQVLTMRQGDRIALKFTHNRKYNLPFGNPEGHTYSTMDIKAVGNVTKNRGDGRVVEVDWTALNPHRLWCNYTSMAPIWEIWPDKGISPQSAEALIRFAFENEPQNFGRAADSSAPEWATADADVEDTLYTERPSPPAYSIDDIINEGCFLPKERLADILESWRGKQNLILQGPPGTGKTWLARKLAYALIGLKDDQLVQGVQFHGNLSYEDFVRGWRPGENGRLELVDGPLLRLIDEARGDPNTDYVMLIEEINRGNPAQIFGEMLTLLEAGKRNEREALALSYPRRDDERVYVPPNLYVIGTMNLTDRSLALVDFAFRRRFAFEELEPVFGAAWRNWVNQNCGLPHDFLAEVEGRLTTLNQQIADDASLGPQFRIGHSFVTPNSRITEAPAAWFRRVVDKEIRPLLNDYWFDDHHKAQQAADALLENL